MKIAILNINLRRIIKEKTNQLKCNHLFEEFGLGFKCSKCKFYTGTWTEANEIIVERKSKKTYVKFTT